MRFRNILVLGLCVLLAATQTQATLRAAIGSTGGSGVSASSPNSWTAAQTFTNSDIKLLGASTGATTLTSANSGASNFTLTLPAVTDTVVTLGASQTLLSSNYLYWWIQYLLWYSNYINRDRRARLLFNWCRFA